MSPNAVRHIKRMHIDYIRNPVKAPSKPKVINYD